MTAPAPARRPDGMVIAADIGGTFTDIVFLYEDGRLDKRKVPTTPRAFSCAIVEGVGAYLEATETAAAGVREVTHATTVATNAILERQGARAALITTAGFRDVLELRRIRIPISYDLSWSKPEPLVERALRFEVDERVLADGSVHRPLDPASLEEVVAAIRASGVASVAVCCLHSYRAPEHEQRIGAALRAADPDLSISLSHEILPEIREYERTSTTVVNAYVGPLVARYLASLRRDLRSIGIAGPLLVMQSAGGLISADTAGRKAVTIIESGPAAGVVAAAHVARLAGYPNVITLDMGGTTTKASIIEDGRILRADEYEVGAEISVSSRLVRGSGYQLKIPVIDISEVGAGGGSIARVDDAGALRVGPRSAGSEPGPACYGMGNEEPTVTDANLVLGFLSGDALAGGSLSIRPDLSRAAVERRVAGAMGSSTQDAARGIHLVANSNMVRAIKTVSVERGRDPADFVLMAFGGAGPLHAAEIARELKIGTVVIPPSPGVFSAFGLLSGQVEQHGARSILCSTDPRDAPRIERAFEDLRTDIVRRLLDEGYDAADVTVSASADLRFRGQSTELNVPMPVTQRLSGEDLAGLEQAFVAEYDKTFGYTPATKAFEFVTARVIGTVARPAPTRLAWQESAPDLAERSRRVYFGAPHGEVDCPVIHRGDLSARARPGPLLIREYDTTIVVPPGCHARLDDSRNVVIDTTG